MRRWKPPALNTPAHAPPDLRVKRGGAWTRLAAAHKRVHLQCAHCGRLHRLETDHIVPKHRGGKDEWDNLQSLCVDCHKAKTAREARGA